MKKQEKSKLKEIEKAVEILKKGGVIIFPTDTVYGLGCRYGDPIGLARIRRLKGSNQSFPILVASINQAHQLAKFSSAAIALAARFWPGALTIILKSQKGDYNIGIRLPDSPLARNLIEKSGFPIIGTSANFHGQKSPTAFSQIDKNLIKKVDFIIKGRCKFKKESTVIDATVNPPKILRRGAISL